MRALQICAWESHMCRALGSYCILAEKCEKFVSPYLKHKSASVHSKIMSLHKSIGKTSLLGYFLTGLQHKQIQQQKLKKMYDMSKM